MRFYVFTRGSPGYISAEVAVRELTDEREARAWASDVWSPACPVGDEPRFISRAEAHMVPLYRDALERWERREDGILQATEVAQILEEHRGEAASLAALGCSVAAAALAADDDEAIRASINEHVHAMCGGRNFPDERPLHGVN
jgi:hypothetical protein